MTTCDFPRSRKRVFQFEFRRISLFLDLEFLAMQLACLLFNLTLPKRRYLGRAEIGYALRCLLRPSTTSIGLNRPGHGTHNAYRGVELAVTFLLLRPRRRGLGGRGWPKCVQLDQGYAAVVSAVDSAPICRYRLPWS